MRIAALFIVAIVACNDPSASPTLCTTSACAAKPCTPGCTFAAPSGAACAATVATSTVAACSGFCGLFTDVQSPNSEFGCWHYDGADPVCSTCGYHGECYKSDESPGVDYRFGGAVCTSRESCGNGGPLEDGGISCPDMIAGGG